MSSSSSTTQLTLYALLISLPLVVLGRIFLFTPLQPGRSTSQAAGGTKTDAKDDAPQTIMQPARDDLEPPKDTPYTQAELAQFDGSDSTKPIYVAIKGTIFDVTRKGDVYGPGKGYNVFAGKDGSMGLGKSSLKPEDAVPDYSSLDEKDRKTLDDWHEFFQKRYNIVGKVSDIPNPQ